MKIKYSNPSLIQITDYSDAEIELLDKKLSYKDKGKVLEYLKFKNNKYLAAKMDREDYFERLDELKNNQTINLLLKHKDNYYTYSGLISKIQSLIPNVYIERSIEYPEAKTLQPIRPLPSLRYYQREVFDLFINHKHGAASLPTGAGKSLVITKLCSFLGLKTVIVTPSDSISEQLYNDLVMYLGEDKVGMYGGGCKESDKLITVSIDKSLIRIEDHMREWKDFGSTKVVIVDESHMVATSVQKQVMLGLLRMAPYRFFLSATQFRNDGADLLLEGITSETIYDIDFRKLVKEGFLAKPEFRIIQDNEEYDEKYPKDPIKALDKYLYKNKRIHKLIALMVNKDLENNKKVLIMIDRIQQFNLIIPYLKFRPEFVYGSLTTEQKKIIAKDYHNKDSKKFVKLFNENKINFIIGTKAIGMGTDIKPVDIIYNLQGGKSDNKFLQLIGRGTRIVTNKKGFIFYDIDQINHKVLHGWAVSRRGLFKSLSDDISYI